ERRAGQGMLHTPRRRRVDDLLAAGNRGRQPGPLATDPREVGGELVELLLTPGLERVMVAFGAFEPDAQEELADHRGNLFRLAAVAEEGRRTIAEGAPPGGHDRTYKLV